MTSQKTFPDVRTIDSDSWYELIQEYVQDDQSEYWTDNDDHSLWQTQPDKSEVCLASFNFETSQVTFYVPFIGIHDTNSTTPDPSPDDEEFTIIYHPKK